MIRIAVCDDDYRFLIHAGQRVKEEYDRICKDVTVDVHIFSDPESMVEENQQEPFDFVYLDIAMPNLSGMQAIARMRLYSPDIILVFVSELYNRVWNTYTSTPLSFIRKGCFEQELRPVVRFSMTRFNTLTEPYIFEFKKQKYSIPRRSIICIQSNTVHRNSVKLITRRGDIYQKRGTMAEAEEEFKKHFFVRIHKGFIINLHHVVEWREKEVLMANVECYPLSREYSDEAFEAWDSFSKTKLLNK